MTRAASYFGLERQLSAFDDDYEIHAGLAASNNPNGTLSSQELCSWSSQASARAESGASSVGLRPLIHLRTESIKTMTAAVIIKTVSEVLM